MGLGGAWAILCCCQACGQETGTQTSTSVRGAGVGSFSSACRTLVWDPLFVGSLVSAQAPGLEVRSISTPNRLQKDQRRPVTGVFVPSNRQFSLHSEGCPARVRGLVSGSQRRGPGRWPGCASAAGGEPAGTFLPRAQVVSPMSPTLRPPLPRPLQAHILQPSACLHLLLGRPGLAPRCL